MKENIRVGLVGLGRMGTMYAQHLAFAVPDAELAALATRRVHIARDLARQCDVAAIYTDPCQLFQQESLDAVVIATPTATHKDFIMAAARAGKHIFCEKPIALTLEETDEALQAVREAGVVLQVGFMRRCDAGYAAAKQQIADGVIGEPVMYKGIGRDPVPPPLDYARPEISGGLLLDLGSHDFDLARWLMGSEVSRVCTEAGTLVFPDLKTIGDIDNAVVNLRFENGSIGNIDVSRNAVYGYDIRTEILGAEGCLQIGYLRHTPLVVMTRTRGVSHDTVPFFLERFSPAYKEQIRLFIRAICEGTAPLADGHDARKALEIGLAAIRSYKTGQPVELAEV
ncbi:inositol 2-dehydrogenase [candidate division KSB3 bacterium]|uniref:Inositol 2-dehydrogenase n=1 Tax=candidate division KSB3 bacterium TaxID=2044937 RepID=A0A2G6E3Z2_9BACT|nr:MAG: inositol 2-dehydrogenase [candidate division KSB3 bacterium]PIE29312.1 MAG: inositol 2-dehydrogenase [candidate division KSB3 bacterium]